MATITVTLDANRTLTLKYGKVTCTATITVVSDGVPIPGATVWLDGREVGTTDSSGKFVAANLSTGGHVAEASKDGYYNSPVVTFSVPETTSVTLTLTKIVVNKAQVRVGVMVDSYATVAGATVTLDGKTGTTDWTGKVDFFDIPYGTYVVTASYPGYTEATQVITVNQSYVTVLLSIH